MEQEATRLNYEILSFLGEILQRTRPDTELNYVEMHPDNPGSFEEEQGNLLPILKLLEEKKDLSFKDLAHQTPGLRRSERSHVRSQDRMHWTRTHAAWLSYSQIFHSVYPLVLTHPEAAIEKLALAAPYCFWECFWKYAEDSECLEVIQWCPSCVHVGSNGLLVTRPCVI